MKTKLFYTAVMMVIFLVSAGIGTIPNLPTPDLPSLSPFEVHRIIDGDTIIVSGSAFKTRTHLALINTKLFLVAHNKNPDSAATVSCGCEIKGA